MLYLFDFLAMNTPLTSYCLQDQRSGISPGFGSTINIINGGVECNTKDGRESKQARNRIEYYKQFAWYLYVHYQEEELGCATQSQFSAGDQPQHTSIVQQQVNIFHPFS